MLRSGDVVNVDASAELDGYRADNGASVAVGEVAPAPPPSSARGDPSPALDEGRLDFDDDREGG